MNFLFMVVLVFGVAAQANSDIYGKWSFEVQLTAGGGSTCSVIYLDIKPGLLFYTTEFYDDNDCGNPKKLGSWSEAQFHIQLKSLGENKFKFDRDNSAVANGYLNKLMIRDGQQGLLNYEKQFLDECGEAINIVHGEVYDFSQHECKIGLFPKDSPAYGMIEAHIFEEGRLELIEGQLKWTAFDKSHFLDPVDDENGSN